MLSNQNKMKESKKTKDAESSSEKVKQSKRDFPKTEQTTTRNKKEVKKDFNKAEQSTNEKAKEPEEEQKSDARKRKANLITPHENKEINKAETERFNVKQRHVTRKASKEKNPQQKDTSNEDITYSMYNYIIV